MTSLRGAGEEARREKVDKCSLNVEVVVRSPAWIRMSVGGRGKVLGRRVVEWVSERRRMERVAVFVEGG